MTATESTASCADRFMAKLRTIPCAGIFLGMLSGIFFATASFIVKMVPDVHPVEVVVTRYVR